MEIICPFCDKNLKEQPIKSWTYGKMIEKKTEKGTEWGASVTCSRYSCKCGHRFNFFLTTKGKSWTIPKSKIKKKDSK